MSIESDNLLFAKRYLAAIEQGAAGEALAQFFAPDVIQEEFPNRLTPQGAARDLSALLEGAERGQKVLAGQRYEVKQALASGERVALEVRWIGTLAVPIGSLPAGGEMRAHLGIFIDFRDVKIIGQRNYDCFDPF